MTAKPNMPKQKINVELMEYLSKGFSTVAYVVCSQL